jgi:3-hydroxy-3-methylglutaryl CoA synthase
MEAERIQFGEFGRGAQSIFHENGVGRKAVERRK